ncbi:biopolymer transporter ExbD [Candidatus Babeliales bacterium]|nr:biopolymer transporter ExbD [Candidatus Babeliales bacterium]
MNKRRLRRLKQQKPELVVNLTPLIDTALTLLVIFMITAPMLQHGIKVELPQGKSQEVQATQKQDVVIYIDKDSAIYCNDEKQESEDALLSSLKTKVALNADQTVYVKADKSISYGRVIETVDRIKYVGGVKYVALATQKRA